MEELMKKGNNAYYQQNFDEAIRLFSEVIKIDAKHQEARRLRAISYAAMGRTRNAFEDFQYVDNKTTMSVEEKTVWQQTKTWWETIQIAGGNQENHAPPLMMNVPVCRKNNPAEDKDCAAVCLQMAVAYYQPGLQNIHEMAESIENNHYYTLPWGVCFAAAGFGFHATFISQNPTILDNPEDFDPPLDEHIVNDQVERCIAHENIHLVNWMDEYNELPEAIIQNNQGIVIATINTPIGIHNVVIVDWRDGTVLYNDPNSRRTSCTEEEFLGLWLNEETGNGLIIISPNELPENLTQILIPNG